MTNIEILISKVKFHLRDVNTTDEEINDIILQVVNEIATSTKIFKKIYGFSIHKDLEVYDFNAITQMNEETELELSSVTIGEPSREELLAYLTDYEYFPSPSVDKTLVNETAKNKLIAVLSIIDDEGRNISDMFQFFGTSQYKLYDELFREENDGMHCFYTASIIPDLNELLPEHLDKILSAVIAGCKFYFNDTMAGQVDAQIANLYYQRYYAKTEALTNLYPTHIVGFKSLKGKRKWL